MTISPPVSDNEDARLRALRRYDVLDTPPDEALDDLVALAAYICEAPIAVISLVDEDRSWYKSRFGITATESVRSLSICAYAICGSDLFTVPDARLDPRFADNPYVSGEPHIRFYAGALLVSPDGYALGTLCVIDHVARVLRPEQEQALRILGRHVMTQLELRSRTRQFSDLQATHAELLRTQQTLRAREMTLDEQYEELDQIYRTVPIGLALIDPELRYLRINEYLAAFNGRSVADHIGRAVEEVVPELASAMQTIFRQVLATGEASKNLETRGSAMANPEVVRDWLASFCPLKSRDGSVRAVACMVQDITDQKRLTEALRDNERHYRLLFEHNPQAMWVCDPQTLEFLAVNQSAIDQYGYSREEFLAMSVADIRPSEDVGKLMIMLTTLPNNVRRYSNVRHRRKDATTLLVDITSHPIVFSGRQARLVLATDVTERSKSEEEQRRLATAIEHAAESIVIADPNGTMVYVNPAFERISGYSSEEAVGKNPRIFKSGVHDFNFYREMWDSISAGHVWTGNVTNRCKGGSLFTEEMSISPIRDATGAIVNYVAVKRDVTREVALEMQLRQAQKMEAIGLLAGGVAHDFNNLLTVIQGNAALLLDDERLSTSTTSLVKEIVDAAERAAGLTRQLLVFSRKQAIQPTQLAVNDVVSNLMPILHRILGESLSLRCEYGIDLPLVHADSGMLEQVLLNLVVNARDAMPTGGQLEIATSVETIEEADVQRNPDAAPGHYVCLRVTDTGSGIASENLARIFEPFFTTKEVGKGTGLGLSTVYGIVKQHHGWIGVVSEVDNGATFNIYLPAVLPTFPTPSTEICGSELPGGDEVILVAEDEPAVRSLVGRLLECCGYTVLSARSGMAALELWEMHKDRIHLLLTDIVMPGKITGYDLAEKLQAERPALKVIFTSGYSADVADQGPALVEGVNIVHKPWLPLALAQAVRNRLDQS